MGYRDRWKRELKRESRESGIYTAMDLFKLGEEIDQEEWLDKCYPLQRGCPMVPRTPLGRQAFKRYLQGKPERRLP